jgi:outer membrane protein OmpA-like peptidoglycan-associated protein
MIQRTLVLLLLSSLIGFSTTSSHAQITVANERGINTAFQEYSPAFYQKGLIFIAANPAVNKDKKEDTQLGKSTTSIFLAKRGNDGNLQRPITFAEELTTKFYDGPLSFNATGDVVFFTRTNLKKGKPKMGRDGKIKLKIYSAKLNAANGKWENIEDLPFNGNDFDCMHPSVSADGQRLYFASNRPGGKGGLDIYVSVMQNGKWSDAVNMGSAINTPKNEVSPFIHPDNTLYFATNGRNAVGGIDIFWTKKKEEGWSEPIAMPEPINSSSDDFGLIITDDKRSGFFSSNRSSGQGDDDIFSFSDNALEAQSLNKDTEPIDIQMITKPVYSEEKPAAPLVKQATKVEKQENKEVAKIIAAKSEVPQTTTVVASDNKEADKLIPVKSETPQTAVVPETKEADKLIPVKSETLQTAVVPETKEASNVVVVEISTIDKTTNKPINDVNVSILNMKSIKNATFLTDATGKVTGLRAQSGAPIPLDILPSQEVLTDTKGRMTVSVSEGDRFIFNFSKAGFDSKYVVKTVIKGDNKVAAFMMRASGKSAVVTKKGLVGQNDTTPRRDLNGDDGQGDRSHDFDEAKIVLDETDAASGVYTFELKGSYYGLGDAEVNQEVKTELEPLLKMMTKDKTIEIEVASYTEAVGKPNFNLTLSQLRADNIKTHFIENGIKPDRIRSFGYGETMIRNRCKRGVNCSEAEHAQNKRSVIKVVKGLDTQVVSETETPQKVYDTPLKKPSTSRAVEIVTRDNREGSDFIASNNPYPVNNLSVSTVRKARFHVIIGTFTKPDNASKQKKKAIDAGFVESEVIQDPETFLYSVSVRLFSDQKEARKLVDYINTQKEFEAFIKEWK